VSGKIENRSVDKIHAHSDRLATNVAFEYKGSEANCNERNYGGRPLP
jgi:hypothetical protein